MHNKLIDYGAYTLTDVYKETQFNYKRSIYEILI